MEGGLEFSLWPPGLAHSSPWVAGENMERWVVGGRRGGLAQGGGLALGLPVAGVPEVAGVMEVLDMLVVELSNGRKGGGEAGAGGGGSSTISSRSSSSNILTCRPLSLKEG